MKHAQYTHVEKAEQNQNQSWPRILSQTLSRHTRPNISDWPNSEPTICLCFAFFCLYLCPWTNFQLFNSNLKHVGLITLFLQTVIPPSVALACYKYRYINRFKKKCVCCTLKCSNNCGSQISLTFFILQKGIKSLKKKHITACFQECWTEIWRAQTAAKRHQGFCQSVENTVYLTHCILF